jgi:hypothetical protein
VVSPQVERSPVDVVLGAILGATRDAAGAIRPEVAVAVATTFGFPLALALLVLLFLLVQSRLDDRDPKLRAAARSQGHLLVGFEDDAS